AYHFIRLGTLLERADNTARILDVKYHVLRPQGHEETTDFYQWGALLRSVSAFENYRKVYRDVITPERVAELLILHRDLPRSLHFCLNGVVKNLEMVANRHSGETLRQAGILHARLHYARVGDILEQGLHNWLTDFMDSIYQIGDGISRDFLVPSQDSN
ncbi:MAG TPA: alpha-E domain-containing protein, partial [Rhodocyclaceae bacterium]|nr:alpha-E domain-containing protein [Rhodocyclaceae bacterium]